MTYIERTTHYDDRRIRTWLLAGFRWMRPPGDRHLRCQWRGLLLGQRSWDVKDADYRAASISLATYLEAIGLKVEVNGGHATVGHSESVMPELRPLAKQQCFGRVGIVYSAFEEEVRNGVPIYQATLFGPLRDRVPRRLPFKYKALTAPALHRNVYLVGRADCARIVSPGARPAPVEAQCRIRPTLGKARVTADLVAEWLPAWDEHLAVVRGRKIARCAEISEPVARKLPPEDEEIFRNFRP